ncbi:Mesocentin [Hoyosella subflava DQS3-9A1]|uniref:Mesocentin n=1 Tax=Hoyosella subflava (strain DSM 45089 / JCM 17490 / NBRC 109087 / DQS3-9A1) TaxID=443218 RepID=F6EJM9_HOYSD|nr:Mesocentin [Hoyosella subflava DQS3-9A1]
MKNAYARLAAICALPLVFAACGDSTPAETDSASGPTPATTQHEGHWDSSGQPVSGGPTGADGSAGNDLSHDYCAHNQDPACPVGSYVGPHVTVNDNHGHWDASGQPSNGGPTGADGSTGNDLTQEYCAQNQDPGCPMGSYVGPDAIPDPDGSPHYVQCEGTVCTNPNHGADTGGYWDASGGAVLGGPTGADGSTGNDLSQDYCAENEDPACPMGSYQG